MGLLVILTALTAYSSVGGGVYKVLEMTSPCERCFDQTPGLCLNEKHDRNLLYGFLWPFFLLLVVPWKVGDSIAELLGDWQGYHLALHRARQQNLLPKAQVRNPNLPLTNISPKTQPLNLPDSYSVNQVPTSNR